MKQDVLLADDTAVCQCVLWEHDVKRFELNQCYELRNVTIKSFNNAKYLSLSDKSSVSEAEDIGEVTDCNITDHLDGKVVIGEIIGVLSYENYSSCITCNGKVVQISQIISQCIKCGLKVKSSRCVECTVARLMIQDKEGNEYRVTAYNDVIEAIINNADGTDMVEKLLTAPMMKFVISSKDVITSVECN